MTCEAYIDLMMKSIDGEASEEETAALHAHLAECEVCRGLYESYLAVDNAVNSTEEELPEQLTYAIMNSIRREQAQNRPKAWLRRYRFTAIAAVAAVVILAAAKLGENVSVKSDLTDTGADMVAAAQAETVAEEAAEFRSGDAAPAEAMEEAIEMPADAEGIAAEKAMPSKAQAEDQYTQSGSEFFSEARIEAMEEAGFYGAAIRISNMSSWQLKELMPDILEIELSTGDTAYQAESDAVDAAVEAGELEIVDRYQPDSVEQPDIYWIFLND